MGMQCHFNVEDIPEKYKVHKHADKQGEDTIDDEVWFDYYIVVDPDSLYFSTDSGHRFAYFDIGQMSASAMAKLEWLIRNRICFNCS